MKKLTLQSGKRFGKWKYQLRLLKRAWKNNKTTALYSGKASKINFYGKIIYIRVDFSFYSSLL